MPINKIARPRKKITLAHYHCGHTVMFQAIYLPAIDDVVWCQLCNCETTMHAVIRRN